MISIAMSVPRDGQRWGTFCFSTIGLIEWWPMHGCSLSKMFTHQPIYRNVINYENSKKNNLFNQLGHIFVLIFNYGYIRVKDLSTQHYFTKTSHRGDSSLNYVAIKIITNVGWFLGSRGNNWFWFLKIARNPFQLMVSVSINYFGAVLVLVWELSFNFH